jgi:hypothetical protein
MDYNEDSNVKPILPDEYDLTSATEDDDISSDKNEDDNDVATTTDDCATPDFMSVEMLSPSSVAYSSSSVSSEEEETRSFEGDQDSDLLELLAETLDVDFDPNLICFE